MRYAFFPEKRRLLIQQGARIDAYDTADHQITGAAQQQGGGHASSSLTFATNHGPISTKELKCVRLT